MRILRKCGCRLCGDEGCTSQRVVRAQFWDMPNFYAHFKIFTLTSAGSDTGNFQFERQSTLDHLRYYLALMHTPNSPFQFTEVEVLVAPIEKRLTDFVQNELQSTLLSEFSNIEFQLDQNRKNGIGYYQSICFTINAAPVGGEKIHLVDGGFTNWTQQLKSNKKERLLISAIGAERVTLLFKKKDTSP